MGINITTTTCFLLCFVYLGKAIRRGDVVGKVKWLIFPLPIVVIPRTTRVQVRTGRVFVSAQRQRLLNKNIGVTSLSSLRFYAVVIYRIDLSTQANNGMAYTAFVSLYFYYENSNRLSTTPDRMWNEIWLKNLN